MGAMPAITSPSAVGTFVTSKGCVHVGSSPVRSRRKARGELPRALRPDVTVGEGSSLGGFRAQPNVPDSLVAISAARGPESRASTRGPAGAELRRPDLRRHHRHVQPDRRAERQHAGTPARVHSSGRDLLGRHPLTSLQVRVRPSAVIHQVHTPAIHASLHVRRGSAGRIVAIPSSSTSTT